ncbi:hypothetical protein BGZ74_009821 [Mortierella antarctica]|nr:hypothetical protein BGZ74_009821 [Mortierella antarctica]
MAHHHASTYHDVKNVPMIVSPLFKVPTPISPPYDMHPLPDDITHRRYHDFALERKIVTAYQCMVAEESAAMEAKENAYRAYSEERQARLKQERISRARKIAPGFLDNEDRRILTPTLATAQVIPPRNLSSSNNKTTNQFDFSEFETNDGSSDNTSSGSVVKDDEVSSHPEPRHDQQQRDSPSRDVCLSPIPDDVLDATKDGVEEEVIVQAVPLSELTGMLRESCLEDDSALNSTPRPWTGHDTVSEKSTLPTFNTRLDYREFEQGLGPPDPWDTPVDDLTALKDVISQQMGQNNGTSHSAQHDPSLQNRPFSQKLQQQPSALQQQHQPTYPYQQTHALSQSYQADTTLQHGQYIYGTNNVSRPSAGTGQQYNSSPIPVPAYVDQKQQHQGLSSTSQQHQQHPQHQQHQQHRHSTGGVGAHPSTGLTASQQHARFGNASPSPPPLPPPPRAMTSSPSGTGAGTPTLAVSRPPLPARPGRPTDLDSPSISSSAPDHVTMSVTERSMTPPRPPLPPPPAPLSSSPSTSSGPSTTAGLRPALKPKPHKEFATTEGMNGFSSGGGGAATTDMNRSMSGNSSGGISGSEDVQQQAAHLAPPQANALIEQLASMGFTREQSREALEKYDYDPTKALNHLLDWG